MNMFRSRVAIALGVLSAVALAGVAAAPVLSKLDSDRLEKKIARINENGRARRPIAMRTQVSEAELNSYLIYGLGQELPAGVTEPSVTIEGDGRVSGRAVVDLSRVRTERSSGGWLDPTSYLAGRAPVTAVGTLRTTAGTGRLDLESATISGVPVPKLLLQTVISAYTRSAENPDGVSLDDTFALPAGIREIQLAKGQAVIVQ